MNNPLLCPQNSMNPLSHINSCCLKYIFIKTEFETVIVGYLVLVNVRKALC